MKLWNKIREALFLVPDDRDEVMPEIQSEEADKVVQYIRDEFTRRSEERRPYELQWRLNQNFLAGNQYCDIDSVIGDIQEIEPVFDWMNAEVYNHLAPIITTRLAKLGRVQPGLSVRPVTSDNEDQMAAKTSTQILKGFAAAQDMNKLIHDAEAWCEICGTVFFKSVWNPDAGRVIGKVNGKTIREGDLQTIVVPALEIYPDSTTRNDVSECQSIMHAKAYTADEIERIWGQRVKGRPVDVFSPDNTGLTAGGQGYNPGYQAVVRGELEDAEIVIEYLERPSPLLPEGRMAVIAGDRLLHLGPLPWRTGEYGERGFPYARMICEPNPGSFFGTSVLERLIPIQRAYNAVQNRIHEYLARATIGVMVAEENSLANPEVLEEGIAPGTVLEIKPGVQSPHWLDSPNIPPTLLNERESLDNQFILISGTSEISRNSNMPSSALSGVAIELLKEQDDTRLSLTAENVRDAVRRTGVIWLRLLRQFATTARITRIGGEDNEIQLVIWRASDLTSDDVIIDTDNELSNTPAQRKNMALELFKAGLYTDPATGRLTRDGRLALMDAFKIGSWETMTTTDELQRQQAQRENQINEEGGQPRVNELDDTELHLAEHTRYVYSAAFRELERDKPEAAERLMNHIREHQNMQQRLAAQQISAQNANIEEAARQKLELEAMTQGMNGGM